MRLEKLAISQFRNIESLCIKPSERFNLLYGLNGQGKTNVLEAIYLLGNPRSFRSSKLSEFIHHGEARAYIAGSVFTQTGSSSIRLSLEGMGKKVVLDDKTVQRASDIHGKINVVVFSPDDTAMVKLGPEVRRRYLDKSVYTSSVSYLKQWHDYQRILKHRNQLLKKHDNSDLSVWTEKLAKSGSYIIYYRQRYVENLNKRLQDHYKIISGSKESVDIIYNPQGVFSDNVTELNNELLSLFESSSIYDHKYGTTSSGPHRDDIGFRINGKSLKAFGSQGQQKSFVLALKMAEMEHLQTVFGEPPLLLLDDLSSELDEQRNKNLLDFITESTIQVFITTTERATAGKIDIPECALFHVKEGNLTFEGTY